jgi:hypothetical protein
VDSLTLAEDSGAEPGGSAGASALAEWDLCSPLADPCGRAELEFWSQSRKSTAPGLAFWQEGDRGKPASLSWDPRSLQETVGSEPEWEAPLPLASARSEKKIDSDKFVETWEQQTLSRIREGIETGKAREEELQQRKARQATRSRAAYLLRRVGYDSSGTMEWLTNVCEPAKTVGCNPCDPSRMGSVAASADDSEAGGGIWPSSQKRSAAYYVRRGFESQAGKAASHKAAPKKWHHDFTSFVRKE